MRGDDQQSGELFSYVNIEERLAADHPLRAIKELVDEALDALDSNFAAIYARRMGRPSIAPER